MHIRFTEAVVRTFVESTHKLENVKKAAIVINVYCFCQTTFKHARAARAHACHFIGVRWLALNLNERSRGLFINYVEKTR